MGNFPHRVEWWSNAFIQLLGPNELSATLQVECVELMMFALTETQSRIDVQHIEAAAAWIRHAVASVRYVFVGADEEAQAEKLTEMVRKLLEFLKQRGSATRREITVECFSRRETKLRIDAAVEHLLGMTPPRIYVQIIDRPLGTPGTPTTVYRAV